jgi:hypothetical protein
VSDFHLMKIRDALLRLDLPLSVDTSRGSIVIVDAKGLSLFKSLENRVLPKQLFGESFCPPEIDYAANARDAQAICDAMNALQELLPHIERYRPSES